MSPQAIAIHLHDWAHALTGYGSRNGLVRVVDKTQPKLTLVPHIEFKVDYRQSLDLGIRWKRDHCVCWSDRMYVPPVLGRRTT